MKVYLDTCVLSRLLDMNMSNENLDALDRISCCKDIRPVTSQKTLEEFQATTDPKRMKTLKILYTFIEKVQHNKVSHEGPATFGSVLWGTAPFGGGMTIENKEFKILNEIFEKDDAIQIYQALSNGCDYFLTLDEKTILRRVKNNISKLNMVAPQMGIGNPIDLTDKLGI